MSAPPCTPLSPLARAAAAARLEGAPPERLRLCARSRGVGAGGLLPNGTPALAAHAARAAAGGRLLRPGGAAARLRRGAARAATAAALHQVRAGSTLESSVKLGARCDRICATP
eukprot:517114-Prymnesium_polylepis.1